MTRVLKVESEGDPWKKSVKPKIRLVGRWLERLGFPPERHVEVSPIGPGVLQLKIKPECSFQENSDSGLQPMNGAGAKPVLHSFEHCIARLEQLEHERRNAFTKAWRERCRREIAEWEAYLAEHYPNLRRRPRNETIPLSTQDGIASDDSMEPF